MGDPRARSGSKQGYRLFTAAAAAVALCLALPAGAQSPSPKRDAANAGVTGSIVGYEESPGTAILYQEEKGGMLTQLPPPTAARGPGKAPVVASGGAAPPAPAPGKAPQRRVAALERTTGRP